VFVYHKNLKTYIRENVLVNPINENQMVLNMENMGDVVKLPSFVALFSSVNIVMQDCVIPIPSL